MAQAQNVADQVNQLVLAMNQLNNQIAAQQQIIDNLQNAPAAAAAAPAPRYRLNFATYSFEGNNPEADYDAFEQNVRVVAACQQYPFPGVCDAIIAQLRGRAAHMARDLVGRYDDFATVDEFLARLRSIFVSPAYMEKARAAFMVRLQDKNETIIAYHGIMRSLWEKAFVEDQRQEALLIRQFIAGLRNAEIMKELSLQNFDNYRDVLAEAMRLEGTFEILKMNIERREKQGQYTAQQAMMMMTPQSKSSTTEAVPMDVGAVNSNTNHSNRGRGNGNHRGNRGRNRGRQRDSHQERGNYQRESSHTQGNRHNQQQRQERMDVNNLEKNQCAACLGMGHWARECATKMKQEQRDQRNYHQQEQRPYRQNQGGFRGGRGGRGGARGRGFQRANNTVQNIEGTSSETYPKNE